MRCTTVAQPHPLGPRHDPSTCMYGSGGAWRTQKFFPCDFHWFQNTPQRALPAIRPKQTDQSPSVERHERWNVRLHGPSAVDLDSDERRPTFAVPRRSRRGVPMRLVQSQVRGDDGGPECALLQRPVPSRGGRRPAAARAAPHRSVRLGAPRSRKVSARKRGCAASLRGSARRPRRRQDRVPQVFGNVDVHARARLDALRGTVRLLRLCGEIRRSREVPALRGPLSRGDLLRRSPLPALQEPAAAAAPGRLTAAPARIRSRRRARPARANLGAGLAYCPARWDCILHDTASTHSSVKERARDRCRASPFERRLV